jgi:hypothetical protein
VIMDWRIIIYTVIVPRHVGDLSVAMVSYISVVMTAPIVKIVF